MWRKGEGGAMSEGRATPPSALVIVPAVMDKHKMLLHNNSNIAFVFVFVFAFLFVFIFVSNMNAEG